ncbi:MAG: hypothetical protein J6M54_01765 [Prevotella sp.]|nr:hypothetical protein [Prevotella sp.]MBR1525301.1 hypothetical protein [Prevotella sp.]
MNQHRSILLCTFMMLFAGIMNVYADEKEITYSYGTAEYTWGTNYGKAETYDVAMKIDDASLVGMKIKRVRIPFQLTEGISNAKAWLSKELPKVKSGKAGNADIAEVDFTVTEGWAEVVFDTPYTLTEEGVYVGYSFKLEKPNDDSHKPILTTSYTSENGFYIHTTGKYRTAWHNLYQAAGELAVEVVMAGENVYDNAVKASWMPELNVKAGVENEFTFEVINQGSNGVKSLDYSIEINGTSKDYHLDLDTPVEGIYGRWLQVTSMLPAVDSRGSFAYTVNIKKVNGADNNSADATGSSVANIFVDVPVHRAVLEEYTGTWCGYCPRGFVGLELMNEYYPTNFIGISYHNGDPMEITADFPSPVSGFPNAWLDRVYQTDAFCGDEDYGVFGIDKAWKSRCDVFAPAVVEIETAWLDENVLQAKSHITFLFNDDDCKYELAYALVADGLTGTSSKWIQSNYYNGDTDWPSSMDLFCNGTSKVRGLVFNDVVIARSGRDGINGSLSAPLVADVAQEHTFQFDIRDAKNVDGEWIPEGQENIEYSVVVMLIDATTGEIVNANKAKAGADSWTGISNTAVNRDASVESVVYFDMQGRKVTNPQNGMFIRSERLSNGKTMNVKVVK